MLDVLSLVFDTIPVFCGFEMSHEILRTERLRLRAYTTADEAELFEVFADPYARRFYPEMADRANVRAWIEWNLLLEAAGEGAILAGWREPLRQ